jgi:hypothetical protein
MFKFKTSFCLKHRSVENMVLSKTLIRRKYHYVESIIRPKTLLERKKSLRQKRKELCGIEIQLRVDRGGILSGL